MFAKSLPSLFTIGNLFLGIVAIIMVFNEKPEVAAMMVIIAMLLDGVDGRVARALNVQKKKKKKKKSKKKQKEREEKDMKVKKGETKEEE